MFQISVVNRTSSIAELDMHRVVRAINRQITEDFEPYWAFGGRLRVEGPTGATGATADLQQLNELRGDAILYVLDSANSNDALGYHDRNLSGIPYGFVFLDLCKSLGDDWSTTLSHEALELVGDPQCNLLVQGPHPEVADRTVYHFFEMCDAVQSQHYEIDGVPVSNFVLPHYFTVGEQPGARNDFCGTGLGSFGVNPGGYIGFFDPASGTNQQFFGHDPKAARRLRIKTGFRSGRMVLRDTMLAATSTATPQGAAGANGAAWGSGDRAAGVETLQAPTVTASNDPIRHVVVLMLENRSFDHVLGALRASFNHAIDGVDPDSPGTNFDAKNNLTFTQKPIAAQFVRKDFKVPHEFDNVEAQIKDGMAHFVDEYRRMSPDAPVPDGDQVMAYFRDGELSALHTLAKNFMVCDRWFSSMPGPTWPNRLFVHSGTTLGDVLMPDGAFDTVRMFFGRYSQPTLYDNLDTQGVSWRIYHGGIPQSIVLTRLKKRLLTNHYQGMDSFFTDCKGLADDFPSYAFIEPRYFAGVGGVENDQHSPAGIAAGEQLIADVYNAIRANQALWESTLLVVTYDEHGGFYDHVQPPVATPPDDHVDNYGFDHLGVRVPAILVSPWVPVGVDHTVYDHTSVLRYACDKWQLPHLCRRTMSGPGLTPIGSFASAISLDKPRTDTPATIAATGVVQMAAAVADVPSSFHDAQTALVTYAELVQQEQQRNTAGPQPAAALFAARAPAGDVQPAIDKRALNVERWMFAAQAASKPPASQTEITVPPDTAVAPAAAASLDGKAVDHEAPDGAVAPATAASLNGKAVDHEAPDGAVAPATAASLNGNAADHEAPDGAAAPVTPAPAAAKRRRAPGTRRPRQ
ncbi:alkaline phosphatase family protein [Paraburkholderia sartisoli]|uniref:Phospholipase C n=1 Tax=Paraburkholderia sartisoli TaxID=83784 RepID=A0A1H4A0R6_9BURK|nr:alkaline phosphatase family protein [Paraburkholderia sartisoli]SEA29418.1 Phospholipase C [Paraburkholderia sartisoli]